MRIQPRQQGLQDLQPSQGHGRGKPQRDLFGDADTQPAPGLHVRRLPLRGRRPPIHVSTGRTFNGGGYLRRKRTLLSHGARGKDAPPATGGVEIQRDERHLPRASHITSTPLPLLGSHRTTLGWRHQVSCQAQQENLRMHPPVPLRPHQLRQQQEIPNSITNRAAS